MRCTRQVQPAKVCRKTMKVVPGNADVIYRENCVRVYVFFPFTSTMRTADI